MYQQAFLQNAVAQNMQIQQQLLMQNQALTQLLQQSGPSSVSSATPMPSMMMSPPSMFYQQEQQQQQQVRPGSGSPNKMADIMKRQEDQLLMMSSQGSNELQNNMYAKIISMPFAVHDRRASVDHLPKSAQEADEEQLRKEEFNQARQRSMSTPNTPKIPPQAPLMASGERNPRRLGKEKPAACCMYVQTSILASSACLDPYTRARTVRIGKWRWPPPKDDAGSTAGGDGAETAPVEGFFEFKMRKMQERKMLSEMRQQEQQQQQQQQQQKSQQEEDDEDGKKSLHSIKLHICTSFYAAREWAEYEAELRAKGRIKQRRDSSRDSFDDDVDDDASDRKVTRKESERSRRSESGSIGKSPKHLETSCLL